MERGTAGERGGSCALDINIFTAAMRTEYLRAMQAVAAPAPFERITAIIPSTARVENYAWMTPAPGVARYLGRRRAAQIDQLKYEVPNFEYDGTMTVANRDVEDDNVNGYRLRMNDLTLKARKPFQSRLVYAKLAAGESELCFDGSYFFATSHNWGGAGAVPNGFTGGGNLVSFTAAASDAVVHRFVLMNPSSAVMPLVYQDRKQPNFETDAGTKQSIKAKKSDYWIDLEGAAAFGYWWDAVMVKITNTPTLIELMTCVDAARQCMRRFTLPVALPTDPVERVHEQTQFNESSSTIVCSTGLEQLFGHLLGEDRVGVSVAGSTAGITSNIYYRFATLITTGALD